MQEFYGERPIRLDRVERIPNDLRALVFTLLHQPPLNQFLQIVESASSGELDVRLGAIFSPMLLPNLAVS